MCPEQPSIHAAADITRTALSANHMRAKGLSTDCDLPPTVSSSPHATLHLQSTNTIGTWSLADRLIASAADVLPPSTTTAHLPASSKPPHPNTIRGSTYSSASTTPRLQQNGGRYRAALPHRCARDRTSYHQGTAKSSSEWHGIPCSRHGRPYSFVTAKGRRLIAKPGPAAPRR